MKKKRMRKTASPAAEITRRRFLAASALGAAACASQSSSSTSSSVPSLARLGYKSPNEKLDIAAIGAGGKGASDIGGLASENVVALCDIDFTRAAKTFEKFPNARKYKDFREMLDKEKLDAVNISTADHTHAAAALRAMAKGVAVYVQKPLTRTVHEARLLTEAARKYRVPTQMGNQGHSGEGARLLCEMIWAGLIGNVKEVHAWTDRPIWPQGIADRLPAESPPPDLAWDLFLGPAASRPYNKEYTPFKWRGWFDFGCGALGDMACHILDAANWSLNLRDPISIECVKQEGRTKECFPTKSIVKFEFGARGSMPPVTVYWYDGGWLPPRPEGIPEDTKLGEGKNGSLFIGDKGVITTGTYGEGTRLLPDSLMADFKPPEKTLTRSPGHYRDFIRACKGGEPACSNFDYAGPFTEWVVLGTIAQRVDGKLLWDSKKLEFTNSPVANQFTKPTTRPGWELPAIA